MPLYEYQCDACGRRFELIQKFSDPAPDACTACGGGSVRRLLSSPAIQFKGTGWYITDYAQKGQKGKSSDSAADTAEKSDAPKTDAAKSDASASPAKTDSTAPSTPAPSKSTQSS